MGRGLAVGNGLTVGVGLGVAVGVGLAVAVAVGVAVGVGVGVGVMSDMRGDATWTVTGEPVLKKPMFAMARWGAASASNRKLYIVPQRTAFAF